MTTETETTTPTAPAATEGEREQAEATMTSKFQRGDTAYLEDGDEVVVLDASGSAYVVVARIFDGGEDGPEEGEPMAVPRVFKTPPCPRLHGIAKSLEQTVEALQAKVKALRDEGQQLAKAKEEIPQMIAKHAALARVLDHIEGKTTHFVVSDWNGVDILTAEEALNLSDERDRRMGHRKLLTLFGAKGSSLDWRINQYQDGSSSYDKPCVPCVSEDDAKAELARIVTEKIAEIVKLGHVHRLADPIKNADKYGVPVAAEVRAMAHAWEVKQAQEALDKAEAIAAAARAKVAALGVPHAP